MSDFVTDFWGWYVALGTIVSIAACALLLQVQSRKRVAGKSESEETTGHMWDEDLAEYNNPLPRWWMSLFWITILFSLVYLALYPGLGTFKGLLGWSSSGQYQAERATADATFGPIFRKYAALDIPAIAANPEARAMGERLYLTYCSQCHGSDGRGAPGYPNLADNDWLWGGTPEAIETTIMGGRNGVMPALGAALGGEADVKNMANYVLSLSGAKHDAAMAAAAQPKFAVCAACHGADGKGNIALGAPNLTDNIWLFSPSIESISETIRNGRNLQMPAQAEALGQEKVRILSGYIWSLSHGGK
jgi:cytochrome c oxidase cbb3-type subunit 3